MQLTNWTRLDMLPSTSRVAQYQSSPGMIHFEALQRMVLYLRSHIDDGQTYARHIPILVSESMPAQNVASLNPIIQLECANTTILGLGDPIAVSHEPVDAPDEYDYNGLSTMPVPRIASVHFDSTPMTPATSTPPVTVLSTPQIEGKMDANHGSVFETIGYSGILLFMLKTAVFFLSKKQATNAYNTAESELYTATDAGKIVKWVRVLMLDFGIPYTAPTPMGEDNEAARIIGHAGRLHVTIRLNEEYQQLYCNKDTFSACNCAYFNIPSRGLSNAILEDVTYGSICWHTW
jgi:hypothetical protein